MYKVKESIIRVNTHAFNEFLNKFSEDRQEEEIEKFIVDIDTRPEVMAMYSTYETFILFDRAKDILNSLVEHMDFEKDPATCKNKYFEFKVCSLYEFRYGLGGLEYWRQIGQANELLGFTIDFIGGIK